MSGGAVQWLLDLPPVSDALVRITLLLVLARAIHIAVIRSNPRWRVLLWRGMAVGLVAVPVLIAAGPKVQVALPASSSLSLNEPGGAGQVQGNNVWRDENDDKAEVDALTGDRLGPERRPSPFIIDSGSADEKNEETGANGLMEEWNPPQRSPSAPAIAFESVVEQEVPPRLPIPAWIIDRGRSLLAAVWGLGVTVLAGRWIRAYLRIRRIISTSSAVSDQIRRMLASTTAQLSIRQQVEVRCSGQVTSPFLGGVRRPVLVLPDTMTQPDYRDELAAILAHELLHVRSRDLLWTGFIQWLTILLWFHPLVWCICVAYASACEEVCDAEAAAYVGDVTSYSGTLANVALAISVRAPTVAAIPMARSAQIVRRLASLKRELHCLPLSHRWAGVTVLLGSMVLGGLGGIEFVGAEASPSGWIAPDPSVDVPAVTSCQLIEDPALHKAVLPVILRAIAARCGEGQYLPQLRDEPGPGFLAGMVRDSADPTSRLISLFFLPQEKWPGPPLFYRWVEANEPFRLSAIPPGNYHIFAIEGKEEKFDTIGLTSNWPSPVAITADNNVPKVEIQMSAPLTKEIRADTGFTGLQHLNADNVRTEELGPYGRVLDVRGRPVYRAVVQVWKFTPDGSGRDATIAHTNEHGYYGLEPVDFPYYVGAFINTPLQTQAGYRWHYLQRNEVFHGKNEIDFRAPPWPGQGSQAGTITGRVVTKRGEPVPAFCVELCPTQPWPNAPGASENEEPWSQHWEIQAAFRDGEFLLADVPAGECRLRLFGHRASDTAGQLHLQKVTVEPHKTVELDITIDWEKAKRAGAGGAFGFFRSAQSDLPEDLAKVGDTAPVFAVRTLDGESQDLTDHRGKHVLLWFWASSRESCLRELPILKSLYMTFGKDGNFVVIGLNMDKSAETARQYVHDNDLKWIQSHIGRKNDNLSIHRYGIRSIPSSILINPQGKILARNLRGPAIEWAVSRAISGQPRSDAQDKKAAAEDSPEPERTQPSTRPMEDVPRAPSAAVSEGQSSTPDRGRIRGIVVSSVTGKPIPGAYVGIGDLEDAPNLATRLAEEGRFAHTETNEEGRFTLDSVALRDHPLLVTHPEYVRHDRVVELRPDAPQTELTITLKPAAKIHVTAVDAAGKPVQEKFTFRLEARDGHRFIPAGKNRHVSMSASPSWTERDKNGSFLFTQLEEGEYMVDVMKRTLEPAPNDCVITHVSYYGGISSVTVKPGEVREVSVLPQDHGTVVEIRLQGEVLTTPAPPKLAGLLISRNTGLLVWDLGLGQGPEFPCLGRVAENPLIRAVCGRGVSQEPLPPTVPFPAGPIRIRNLPPGSYSLFVYVVPHMVLKGVKVEVVRGQVTPVTIDLVQWKQLASVNLLNMGRRVRLKSKEYRVQELCDLLSAAAEPVPQFQAAPSLRDEKLRFEAGEMSTWEALERIYQDKGWVAVEEGDKTLIVVPPPTKPSKPGAS